MSHADPGCGCHIMDIDLEGLASCLSCLEESARAGHADACTFTVASVLDVDACQLCLDIHTAQILTNRFFAETT